MQQPFETTLQSLLGESFKIQRELPGGGMSRVFVAFEPALKRDVVVKVLPPDLRSTIGLSRFTREIEVTARLQHPHILPVITTGGNDQLLYYVVPYVEGGSLRDQMLSGRPMSFDLAIRAITELLAAVGFAHDRGVVHRDIKPGNVLLSEGHAILADFGIATFLQQAHEADADGSQSVASPAAYRAPERPRGEAADLYAVAVLSHEILAGRLPDGLKESSIAAAILDAHPDVPGERVREVARVLGRALAKDPAQRYANAGAFSQALASPVARGRFRVPVLTVATAIGLVSLGVWRTRGADEFTAGRADTTPAQRIDARQPVVALQPAPVAPRDELPPVESARLLVRESLWLAWSDAPDAREDATQAASRALAMPRLGRRDALMARGVAALGRHDHRAACSAFDSALAMRADFDAWMGVGECRFRDTTVVVDDNGVARFRSSYHRAARSYVEAARLAPPAATLPYRRLLSVAFTEPARIRRGWTADGRMYLGQPIAAGDSIAFEAFPPGPRRITPTFVSANFTALSMARAMLRPAVSAWVRRDPGNVDARLTLVQLLESAGNIREPGSDGLTALSEVESARSGTPTPAEGLRLAHTHVRLLLRARQFESAATIADSLLASATAPSPREAESLVSLAFLTGKAARAEELLQMLSGTPSRQIRLADGRPVTVPPVMIRERAAFLVSATLGICSDAVRAAPARLAAALETMFPSGAAPRGVEVGFLERPLVLAMSCVGAEAARAALKEPSGPLARGLLASTEAEQAEWVARLAQVTANRATGVLFESTESSLAEALLHLQRGDSTAARITLRRVLDALPALPPSFLNNEMHAGTLPRAMALAAELAATHGDSAEARRWSLAVMALWENADAALRPIVQRMHEVHDELGDR